MKIAHSVLAFLPVFSLLFACGKEDEDRIDGPYAVTFGDVSVQCTFVDGTTKDYGPTPQDSRFGQIDVLARQDGLVDLLHDTWYLANPESGKFAALAIDDGKVRYVAEGDDTDFGGTVTVTGEIGKASLSFRVTEFSVTPDGTRCDAVAAVSGNRRPVTDPDAIDGIYVAEVTTGEYGCPAPAEQTRTHANQVMDVMALPDAMLQVTIADSFRFVAPAAADGLVSYAGALEESSPLHGSTVVGSVSGTLGAADADLAIAYGLSGQPGCGVTSTVRGHKAIPDAGAIANTYGFSADFTSTGSCALDDETVHAQGMVAENGDGGYTLTAPGADAVVIHPDAQGAFREEVATIEADGVSILYEGSVQPPRIAFTGTYHAPGSDDGPCDMTVAANGYVRFIK